MRTFLLFSLLINLLSLDGVETNNLLGEIKEMNIQKENSQSLKDKVEESEYYEMLGNLRMDKITKIIMAILGIMQILNIAVFLGRDPIQKLVFNDIKYHIMTVDLENWISFSQIHPAIFVDVSRAGREGWIENESFIPYENGTATNYSMDQWRRSTTYPWACERLLIRNHSNITMGFLYQREKWINDFNDVDFFYNRTFANYGSDIPLEDRLKAQDNAGIFTVTKDLKWRKENLHRS